MLPILSKPEIIEKVWGKEIIIINSPLYCGKILEFNKGYYSSVHFHKLKTETWYVLKGLFLLEYQDDHKKILHPNDVIHLNANTVHKLTSLDDGQILEVSTQHFDDDSYRLENSGKLSENELKTLLDPVRS